MEQIKKDRVVAGTDGTAPLSADNKPTEPVAPAIRGPEDLSGYPSMTALLDSIYGQNGNMRERYANFLNGADQATINSVYSSMNKDGIVGDVNNGAASLRFSHLGRVRLV